MADQMTQPQADLTKLPESKIMEILADGTVVMVKHSDGSEEQVKARKIPASQIHKIHPAMARSMAGNGEAAEIAAYCNQSIEWAESLDDESFERLIEVGRDQNSFTYRRWQERQAKFRSALATATEDKVEKILRDVVRDVVEKEIKKASG